ncbi:MAG: CARDB domain-containing protein, partial [Desulfatitalea sp.]
SYLEITSGNVTKDATWTAAIPYVLSGYSFVQGTDGADAITTLTIAPGAVLKFNQSRYLNIGAASGSPGALIAQGTAANPILFTSNQATPTAGYWNQIKFDNTANDATTALSNCVVEYGGSGSQGMILLNNAKPTIAYCKFRYSSHAGLYVAGSDCTGTTINCNTFFNNAYGLYVSSALPLIQQNNFNGNTNYGLYFTGSGTLSAENNWWGSTAGPNTTGDRTYGNVDADPWSAAENQCGGASQNYPPFAPSAPVPADNAVRIAAEGGVTLGWGCSDPNALDTLTYAIHLGTTSGSLQLQSQSIAGPSYTTGALLRGKTYFWKVVARDSGGLETAGPVWRFTTAGDPPDLVVSSLTTSPAGGMRANSNVILIAQITNAGNGPVVDGFSTEFKVNGTVIGSIASNQILAAGASMPVTRNWTYTGGNPTLAVKADSLNAVTETNEANNQLQASLSVVADITAPALSGTLPANGAQLQQVQQISASLIDTQSAVNDATVISSFTVTNSSQQTIAGTVSESNDTFTFIHTILPLADGVYLASMIAADTYGNTQNYSFNFTIDTQPPAKPTITGGTVQSGTIQPRPTQNTANRVIAELKGSREGNTSLWTNGVQRIGLGSG